MGTWRGLMWSGLLGVEDVSRGLNKRKKQSSHFGPALA